MLMFWSRISDSSRVFITWLNSETVMVGGGFIYLLYYKVEVWGKVSYTQVLA